MAKYKALSRLKYDGDYVSAGQEFEVKKGDKAPRNATLLKEDTEEKKADPMDEFEGMSEEQLYGELQALNVEGRTKIREEGIEAMKKAILENRGE